MLILQNQTIDENRINVQIVMHDAIAQTHNGTPCVELLLRDTALMVQPLKRVMR